MSLLGRTVCGVDFQNPVLLASGTAAYGRELAETLDLQRLGGLVTKAVSLLPRNGARSPRVTEHPGGMLNAVGLANPGVDVVLRDELPWLAGNARECRVLVNVVGFEESEFAAVIGRLDAAAGFQGYELNLSCPNVKKGGLEFGADAESLRRVVSSCRAATSRPIFVKLSPALPDIAAAARVSADAGADALTLVNTMPGLLVDIETRRPRLGFGSGGASGPGLLPAGVLATWRARQAVSLPIAGAGGISSASDALQYIIAGASLVQVGTAALRDPRAPQRIVDGLSRWCAEHGVTSLSDLTGTLEWPAE